MQLTGVKKYVFLLFLSFFASFSIYAQQKPEKKYPSLLWEITGNGLKKPSYLFGTMHVSNKMVFHLSDSFFMAIKNADLVGLELNSETWQDEMVAMDKQKGSYFKFYGAGKGSDFSSTFTKGLYNGGGAGINEYTFRQENYPLPMIQNALQETPYMINALLYRNREYKQDFEENTFLDMYIYQTGKKLGKKSVGMETIFTMEKYTTEAEIDRANEKVKKKKKFNYDNIPEMSLDEAYRKGDLDMLDSLERLNTESEAFIEKFLYQRNDVQANSMDTILKKGQSLFVGVGAAHLAGKRGVIEILRKKGYTLRPIKMQDRDAGQREKIDKIRVPVKFLENISEDNFYKVKVPGKLYVPADSYSGLTVQYADMSNGTYYMVTRVPTLAAYFNVSETQLQHQIDSILYENIPGSIFKKTRFTRNGYPAIDVTNKTRRGDYQRYNIFITPFEVLIFKISGNENYILLGTEAQEFFNSIQLKEFKTAWTNRNCILGNYSTTMPHEPWYYNNPANHISMFADKMAGVQYLVQRQQMVSYDLSIEDSLLLVLMEESFIGAEKKVKTLQKSFIQKDGGSTLLVNYSIADSFLQAKYLVKGNDLYVVAAKGKNKNEVWQNKFIPNFKMLAYSQAPVKLYNDSFLQFTVKTPVVPVVDDTLKALFYKFKNTNRSYYGNYGSNEPEYDRWGKTESMFFKNDTTGEAVEVSFQKNAKYYFSPDSLKKEKEFIDSMALVITDGAKLASFVDSFYAKKFPNWYFYFIRKNKMYQYKQYELYRMNGYNIRKIAYTDTGTTKLIRKLEISKDDYTFHLDAITDTSNSSAFINTFFDSFMPYQNIKGNSVFDNKTDLFFKDYYSTDTVTRKIARSAIPAFQFTKKEWPRMMAAYRQLTIKDKDYFDTRNKWINALVQIEDSTLLNDKLAFLQDVYEKALDTSIFQNTVLNKLIELKTTASYQLFKTYVLLDPPLTVKDYDYSYDYESTLNFFGRKDSLELVRTLFPEILDLTGIEEYKTMITNTLLTLVDSNKITTKAYERYSAKILFDAKIALKKKQLAEEKKLKNEIEKDIAEGDETELNLYEKSYDKSNNEILDYIKLLLPFYKENIAIPNFLAKVWKLKDDDLKFNLLLKAVEKNIPYPDTLIQYFANKEAVRGDLYYRLHKMNHMDLFPAKYMQQETMATAFLYTNIDSDDKLDSAELQEKQNFWDNDIPGLDFDYAKFSTYLYNNKSTYNGSKMDSLQLLRKEIVEVNKKKGYVYIYKYRKQKEDKWRLAFSGLQPLDGKSISYKNYITALVDDAKIKEDEPLEDQIQLELKKIKFEKNPKTASFFVGKKNRYNNYDY